MIHLSIADFLTILYLLLVFGSLVPVLMEFWASKHSFETWLKAPQHRAMIRAEALVLLPIIVITGVVIAIFGFALYGVDALLEFFRTKRPRSRK